MEIEIIKQISISIGHLKHRGFNRSRGSANVIFASENDTTALLIFIDNTFRFYDSVSRKSIIEGEIPTNTDLFEEILHHYNR